MKVADLEKEGVLVETLTVFKAVSFIGLGISKAQTIGTPQQKKFKLDKILYLPGQGVLVVDKGGDGYLIPSNNIEVLKFAK